MWSGLSDVSLWSLWSGLTGVSLWPLRSGLSDVSLWSLRSGLTGVSLWPLRSGLSDAPLRSLWSGLSGLSLRALWSGLSGLTGVSLRALWSGLSGVSLWSLRSGLSGLSLRALWSGRTCVSLRSGFTLVTLGALRAGASGDHGGGVVGITRLYLFRASVQSPDDGAVGLEGLGAVFRKHIRVLAEIVQNLRHIAVRGGERLAVLPHPLAAFRVRAVVLGFDHRTIACALDVAVPDDPCVGVIGRGRPQSGEPSRSSVRLCPFASVQQCVVSGGGVVLCYCYEQGVADFRLDILPFGLGYQRGRDAPVGVAGARQTRYVFQCDKVSHTYCVLDCPVVYVIRSMARASSVGCSGSGLSGFQ